jgi:GT2 family glycosyltransferase
VRVSVIVPTKNRAALLADTVAALLAQSAVPAEIIVVDQSPTDDGERRVRALIGAAPAPRRPALVYVRDPNIPGAAAARNVGLDLARADVVVFVDDDVLPAPDVIERLLGHYARSPEVAGIAPVITNYPPPGVGARVATAVFRRGPFRDERQPVYWWWRAHRGTLVPVRMFTGAMMSFRRAAVGGTRFDARYRGASTGEDIDLCWSLGARGRQLAIATDTQIVHNKAPRPAARPEAAEVASWAFLYDKHVRKTMTARLAFAWFLVGMLLCSAFSAVRERSWAPLASVLVGLRWVFGGFAGATFLAPPPSRDVQPVARAVPAPR